MGIAACNESMDRCVRNLAPETIVKPGKRGHWPASWRYLVTLPYLTLIRMQTANLAIFTLSLAVSHLHHSLNRINL